MIPLLIIRIGLVIVMVHRCPPPPSWSMSINRFARSLDGKKKHDNVPTRMLWGGRGLLEARWVFLGVVLMVIRVVLGLILE
jgi:hypothetical protein